MSERKCSGCDFLSWTQKEGGDWAHKHTYNEFWCHRYPKPLNVQPEDWCGEFKENQAEIDKQLKEIIENP